ncbi:MAG: hypothetical protein MI723_17330 [Caulobacterales bacterium]|nr:hypothetical protein [Caulobacterales bacterium]
MFGSRLLLALVAGACLIGAPADARDQQWDPRSGLDADRARDFRQRGEVVPMKTVRQMVLQNYPGAQFLDARITSDRAGAPREVQALIMHRGRRVVVRLDAETGHFLGEAVNPPASGPLNRPRR